MPNVQPVRSEQYPAGLPEVLEGPDTMLRRRVVAATAFADICFETALRCLREGIGFAIDNPRSSLMWHRHFG